MKKLQFFWCPSRSQVMSPALPSQVSGVDTNSFFINYINFKT